MAAAGVLSAQNLRLAFRGAKDDEGIKRFVLSAMGYRFCRRRGKWFKGNDLIDPGHELEAVLALLCAEASK